MPSLIGSLFVSLTADFAPFQRNMRQAEGVVASTSQSMRRSMGLTERSVTGLQRQMSSNIRPYALIAAARTFDTVQQRANLLRGALFATTAAFGGLGAALTTNVVSRYLDSFTSLENQMRVVSSGSADLAAQIGAVQASAERSRSSLTAVATLYSRLSKASPGEGPVAILRRVETINKALQLGGATAQEASSAAIQFSQAIASNRLGGEELRAVLETPLGLELARGMGVTIGKFREMGHAGELTADVLNKALDKISGKIDGQFASSIATIDQSLTVVDAKITAYAGSLDKAYGITSLISGAILGFGNNLETIIPLLGQAAIGLGALYAARGGGALLTRAGAPIAAVRALRAAKLDDLRMAREEVDIAKRFAETQRAAAQAAAKTAAGDVTGLAPKAVLKQYERDLAAVQKADADHLALIDKKAQASVRLGEVYRTTTVGEIKAAKALAEQEDRVLQAINRREAATALRAKGDRQLFQMAGLPATDPNRADILKRTKAVIKEIEKEQISATKNVEAEERKLATLRDNLVRQNGAAYTAAAQQRSAILLEEKRLTEQVAKSDRLRVDLVDKLARTRTRVSQAGGEVAGQALREAEENARAAARGYDFASNRMVAMSRAASGAAIAVGLLSTASKSLVAFLGGGWGVAILAAAAAFGYLGSQAAKAAAEEERYQRIRAQYLDKAAESGGQDARAAALSLIADKEKALNEELEVTKRQYDQVIARVSNFANSLSAQQTAENPVLKSFKDLFNQFRAGEISLDEFQKRVNELNFAFNPDILTGFNGAIDEMRAGVSDTTIVVNELIKAIKALELERLAAGAKVEGDREQFVRERQEREAAERKAYGIGQARMREELEIARKRKEILDAAGDTGDKQLNTAAKIAKREQELLEQGYARTREEARALAEEELNLAEANRLSAKTASDAAKEYETFANKLKELEQQAAAAFLSDLDRQVVDFAKSLKDGSRLMAEYIAAINSGDMSLAPPELLQARDALLKLGAADTWNDIIEQYGTAAQLAGRFADKQAELNYLVSQGRITIEQAQQAYADFVTGFSEFEWIDDVAGAFSSFASSAITDFENIEDAARSLVKNLLNIFLKISVLEPLENYLRSMMSNIASGAFVPGKGGGLAGLLGLGLGPSKSIFAANSNVKPPASINPALAGVGSTIDFGRAAGSLVGNATKEAYRNVIASIESAGSGGYAAMGPWTKGDRAYGRYQIMGKNIPSWSKDALGRSIGIDEFMANPGLQDKIFDHRFGGYVDKYGFKGASQAWFAGEAGMKNLGARDVLGTSVAGYGNKAAEALDKLGNKANSAVTGLDGLTSNLNKVGTQLTSPNGPLGGLFGTGLNNTTNFMNGRGGGLGALLGYGGGAPAPAPGGGGLGGIFGFLGSIFSLFFHGGGKVGAGGRGRMVPASAFIGAPRLHSGLKSDEFTAVLQKGERVLTERDEARNINTMRGLSRRASNQNQRPGKGDLNVHVHGASGDPHVRSLVDQGVQQGLSMFYENLAQGGIGVLQKRYNNQKA